MKIYLSDCGAVLKAQIGAGIVHRLVMGTLDEGYRIIGDSTGGERFSTPAFTPEQTSMLKSRSPSV